MDGESRSLLFEIVCGFLVPGEWEPLKFTREIGDVVREGVALASMTGELADGMEELLALTYHLDGRGDSPGAAESLRRAIADVPEALAAIGLPPDHAANTASTIREEAKRRARKKAAPVADWRVKRSTQLRYANGR